MGMTICRECGEKVSSKADKCPSCGIKNPATSKNILENIAGIIVFIFIGFITNIFFGSSNKAECKILSRSLDPDVFVVQGEPDAGYRYNVRIKNLGDKGNIYITAKLSTSEGDFERKQTLEFDTQESANLSYSFPEPSINVSNVQGSVSCRP